MESFISPIALCITLTGVYIFFKINILKDLMVGQGAAIVSNYDNPVFSDDFKDLYNARQIRRLRDAVLRKNIYGIEEGIIYGAINELKKQNLSEKGFYCHVLPIYIKTKKSLKHLVLFSIITLSALFLSMIGVLTKITLEYYKDSCMTCSALILLIIIAIAFILTMYIIGYSILKKVGFEKDKIDECKKLRKENPEIDKLYYSP